MPPSAPAHSTIRITSASVPFRASSATGVYVPAISTKIMEWSSRRIQRLAAGRQVTRWYRALVPSSADTAPA